MSIKSYFEVSIGTDRKKSIISISDKAFGLANTIRAILPTFLMMCYISLEGT